MGVELFATMNTLKVFKLKSKFRMPITFSYTYTNAEFSSSFESDFESWGDVYEGYEFPYLAKHQVSGKLSLCNDKFEFYLNAKYNSTMRAQAGNDEISSVENIPGYLILDAVLKYHINEKICLNLNTQNLTNKAYVVALRPAGLRPGLPRIIQFGINANL